MAEGEKADGEDKAKAEGEDKAAEGGTAGDGGTGDADDVAVVGDTVRITREEFFKREFAKAHPPIQGDTTEELMHWSRPRRWEVRLWNVRIENLMKIKMAVFANFIFGGTREEFAVKGGKTDQIWVAGEEGHAFRTPIVEDGPADGVATECEFDETFEWHGSYSDLGRQKLRVELWDWSKNRMNKFDCFHEEDLESFARGSVFHEVECVKMGQSGKGVPRAKVYYNLAFQEIYDFELHFMFWRASDLLTCAQVLDQLANQQQSDANEEAQCNSKQTKGLFSRSSSNNSHKSRKSKRASLVSVQTVVLEQQLIEIRTPGNKQHWLKGTTLTSCKAGRGGAVEWEKWKGTDRAQFRGTASELKSQSINITVYSGENPKRIGIGKRPKGSRSGYIPLGICKVPLAGVLDHGDVKAQLALPRWFYQMEGGSQAHRLRCGLVAGHIAVEHKPRFKQSDEIDELDFNKKYLFVKVVKVDKVMTPDTRPTEELDCFVEVTWDGISKRTRVIQDNIAPTFNDDLVFEVNLAAGDSYDDLTEQEKVQALEEIELKGPVHFNLWTEGPVSRDHLGSCKAYLSEILQADSGEEQPYVDKTAKDSAGSDQTFRVRCFRGSKRFAFMWGKGKESNLQFEMWFMGDLGSAAKLQPKNMESDLPKHLSKSVPYLRDKWAEKTKGLDSDGRSFACTRKSQKEAQAAAAAAASKKRGAPAEHLLPRLLDVIKPPLGIDTGNAVCHYVGCMPYKEKKLKDQVAYTPDFFCMMRGGDALDHALFHTSLLLGRSERAFVCLGTSWKREPHAWVGTFESDGSVRFWEPYLGGGSYVLPGRFAHPEFVVGNEPPRKLTREDLDAEINRRKRLKLQQTSALDDQGSLNAVGFDPQEPVIFDEEVRGILDAESSYDDAGSGLGRLPIVPYRTIEVIFDHTNCWANLQHGDPTKIFWDIWNSSYWYAFAPKLQGLRPCFQGYRFVTADRDEDWYDAARRSILQSIRGLVRLRRSQKNLDTYWVRTPSLASFLEAGLRIRAELDVCDEKGDAELSLRQQLHDWHQLLQAKTPPVHKLRAVPIHMNFYEPLLVAKRVIEQCAALQPPLVECREKTTQFAVALHFAPMPGEAISLYVCFCEIHELSDVEVKAEFDTRSENEQNAWAAQGALKKICESDHEERTLEAKGNMPLEKHVHFPFQQQDEVEAELPAVQPDKKKVELPAKPPAPAPALDIAAAAPRPPLGATAEGDAPPKPKRAPMSGSEDSQFVRVTGSDQGSLTATNFASKEDSSYEMCGGVLGNGAIPASAEGKYLEVRDLPGSTKGVSVVPDHADTNIRRSPDALISSQPSSTAMRGFHRSKLGKHVTLSANGREATRASAAAGDSQCLLIGDGALEVGSDGSASFAISITSVRTGSEEGLALGVTTQLPDTLVEFPESGQQLEPSWLVGYDGAFWNGSEFSVIDWSPSELVPGDLIQVTVTQDSELQIWLNRTLRASLATSIPSSAQLVPLVELCGNTSGVAISDARGAALPPLGNVSSASSASYKFDSKMVARNITLSPDGSVATRNAGADDGIECVVVSDRALDLAQGASFVVTVTAVRQGSEEGMAVGVTACQPKELRALPPSGHELVPSWLVGYDGASWEGSRSQWAQCSWSSAALNVGDVVRVSITAQGKMQVSVNESLCMTQDAQIPTRAPLWAVVDLLGNTAGVAIGCETPSRVSDRTVTSEKKEKKDKKLKKESLKKDKKDKKDKADDGGKVRKFRHADGRVVEVRVDAAEAT